MKQVVENYNTFSQLRDNSTDHRDSHENCVRIYGRMKDILRVDHELSKQKAYKMMDDLGDLTTLAYNCENGLPSTSPTAAITEDMLLMAETAVQTHLYIVGTSN